MCGLMRRHDGLREVCVLLRVPPLARSGAFKCNRHMELFMDPGLQFT